MGARGLLSSRLSGRASHTQNRARPSRIALQWGEEAWEKAVEESFLPAGNWKSAPVQYATTSSCRTSITHAHRFQVKKATQPPEACQHSVEQRSV